MNLPEELRRGFQAVVRGIVESMVSYASSMVRGYEPFGTNSYFDDKAADDTPLVARLHNDDVHTFDEVINALIRCGKTRAVAGTLTTAVDQQGYGVVHTGLKSESVEFRRLADILSRDAGLLFSIVPEGLVAMDGNIAASFGWLLSFGNANDGLARMVAHALCDARAEGPAGAAFTPTYEEDSFPLSIPYLRKTDLTKLYTTSPTATCAPNKPFLHLVSHPFDCCPRTPLAVLLMASPFLGPNMGKGLNDLVIIYQQDALFKGVFSQVRGDSGR